jgi:RNA polymerase sigma-70 factor (ECF subfamily)
MAGPGNKGFVEGLFARHQAALQTFFRRRIRTSSDALDLVQEVYLRMLRVSDTEAIRNPEVYLFTVASNLVKEHAVLDRRQAHQVDIDEWSVQESLGEMPPLDGQLDTRRRLTLLREVLEQLPPRCRTAVLLQYRDGLTYQQIAGRLGVSPHMVKKYLAQGLAHCRRRMARLK